MSFIAGGPKAPTSSAPERQAYDPGGPLPVHWGWARCAVKWVDHPFNGWQQPNRSKQRPNHLMYSLVGLVCAGPVDKVFSICFANGTRHWMNVPGLSVIERGEDHYFQGKIGFNEWECPFRFYFGRVDQPRDGWLAGTGGPTWGSPNTSPRDHPAYAGMAYVIFEWWNLDMGLGQSSGNARLPQVEFIVWRGTSLGGSSGSAADTGVVPIGAAYDLLTDPVWGGGLSGDVFDVDLWQSRRNTMAAIGYHWHNDEWGTGTDGMNVSPMLAEHREVSEHLGEVMSLYDGFLKLNDDGQVEPGWVPHRDEAPPEETPTLTRADFVEEPVIEPGDSSRLADKITVTYRELRAADWLDPEPAQPPGLDGTAVTARNPHMRNLHGGEVRSEDVDAPALNRRDSAHALAHRVLHQLSEPGWRIRVKVLRDAARHTNGNLVRPGDLVFVDYGPHGTHVLYRVVDREDNNTEEVRLLLELEPAFSGNVVDEPEDSRIAPDAPPVAALVTPRTWEIPVMLAGSSARSVAMLSGRGDLYTSSAEVYWSATGSFTGEEARLDDLVAFSAAVTISAVHVDYEWVEFEFSSPDALPWTDQSYSAAAQQQDTLLLVVGDAALSLGDLISSSGTGPWTRRYATIPAQSSVMPLFIVSSPGHLFLRSNLPIYTHADFATHGSGWFRLVPRGLLDSGPPSTIPLADMEDLPPPRAAQVTNADSGGAGGPDGTLWLTNEAMLTAVSTEDGHPITLTGKPRMFLSWSRPQGRWVPQRYMVTIWFALSEVGEEEQWTNLTVFRPPTGASISTYFDFPRPGWYWIIIQTLDQGRLSHPDLSPQGWVYTDTGQLTNIEATVEDLVARVEVLES